MLSSFRFVVSAVLLLACLLTGCASPRGAASATETRLADLMARRLEISEQVAWTKFQNNTPVRDPRREAEVLDSLVRQGGAMGIEPRRVERFFKAQITASRQVQTALIDQWQRGAPLPAWPPQDLRRTIRPELDRISGEMLACLRQTPAGSTGWRAHAYAILRQHGLASRPAATAASGLPR